MRNLLLSLFAIFLFGQNAFAANRHFHNYTFEAYVVSDSWPSGRIFETWAGSEPVLKVKEGQEYSIVVRNPLPVRVAAAVSVDGLNTIDGKRTSPAKGAKWMIEPYSQITIRGWQTSNSDLRKFIFSKPENSYADWKGRRDRRNYSRNLGVIGVAYFWNSHELAAALNPPQAFDEHEESLESADLYRRGRKARPSMSNKAGTGMGRHQRNQVTRVNFHFDSGMYSGRDALKIRYEFDRNYHQPVHYCGRYQRCWKSDSYTPEMP